MASTKDSIFASLFSTLQAALSGDITAEDAASRLGSIPVSEKHVEILWPLILRCAREYPENHDKLVQVVVHISKLPGVAYELKGVPKGTDQLTWSQMPLFGLEMNQVWNGFHASLNLETWSEMPLFSLEMNSVWNSFHASLNLEPKSRIALFPQLANANRFAALLNQTGKPAFNYRLFALWTFRAATEKRWSNVSHEDTLEAWVPAAVAWLEVSGHDIYEWDDEYENGPLVGARGRGGPLWKGKHGFCKERWSLWRERFSSIAGDEEMGEGVEDGDAVRVTARRAEEMMRKIEDGEKS